jgi:glycosyltransferase involved in cell wall biosynthesis
MALPRLASWLSQRVISNSRPTQDWLLSQVPSLAKRAAVVFNGLPSPPQRDPAAAKAFRLQLGLQEADLLVTLAGRLNHWKGQDLLIEAASLLQSQGQLGRLRFAIVGDVFAGHEDVRSRLLQQVSHASLQEHFHFVPFVHDIYPVWWASDIAVVPSLEPEPFGMVAIEAMACNLPVIAAAHGGLLDIVEDDVTGLLFQPRNAAALAEALQKLAGDAALRKRMGDAGAVRQGEMFSLRVQVEQMQRVCMEMKLSQ